MSVKFVSFFPVAESSSSIEITANLTVIKDNAIPIIVRSVTDTNIFLELDINHPNDVLLLFTVAS